MPFQSGVSGNPNGQPIKRNADAPTLRNWWLKKNPDGTSRLDEYADICWARFTDAQNPDAAKYADRLLKLMERAWGKPEGSEGDGAGLTIKIVDFCAAADAPADDAPPETPQEAL